MGGPSSPSGLTGFQGPAGDRTHLQLNGGLLEDHPGLVRPHEPDPVAARDVPWPLDTGHPSRAAGTVIQLNDNKSTRCIISEQLGRHVKDRVRHNRPLAPEIVKVPVEQAPSPIGGRA